MKKLLLACTMATIIAASEPPATPQDPTLQYLDKKACPAIIHDAYYEAERYDKELPVSGNTPTAFVEKVTQRNSNRKEGRWPFSHLRTFYAWLFKSIKLQDLLYEGNPANMHPAPDVAISK